MQKVIKTKKGLYIREHKGFGLLIFSPFSGLFLAISIPDVEEAIKFCNGEKNSLSSIIANNLSVGMPGKNVNVHKIEHWLPAQSSFSFENGLPDKPLIINWLISNRCNFTCQYCYAGDVIDKPFDSIKTKLLAKNILSYNPLAVVLSGGEPLMFKNELLEAIEILGGKTGIIIDTNGYIYDSELVKSFKKFNVVVRVSLDSLIEEENSQIRPLKNKNSNKRSLPTILENIIKYKNNRIPVIIQTVVTSVNKNTLQDMYSKLPSLKVNGWRIIPAVSPNDIAKKNSFFNVMIKGRIKNIQSAQTEIQSKLKIITRKYISKPHFSLEVISNSETKKNSVILVLPSGRFMTEDLFNNIKIDVDRKYPFSPKSLFNKTTDLTGHYERYLGIIKRG